MHTKMRSQLHGSVDKIVEEAIRRELQRHDDIARLVWWAGSLSRAELVSSSSNTLRVCLGDKSLVRQVVTVDLSAASAVIDKGSLSLHQKAVKKAIDSEFTTAPRAGLPRSKNRSRQQVVTTTDDFRGEMWNSCEKKLLKDKKVRLECLDTWMKTPNAHDGFAYNKIIMGVGIYSQYEFDEDNNLRKHLTHIVKWNNPNESSVRFEDLTDPVNGTSRLCDATNHSKPQSGYLCDLREDVVDPRDGVKLRKVKRAALSTYDKCIILTSDALTTKRRGVAVKFSCPWEDQNYHDVVRESENAESTKIFTLHDIDAVLRHKFELKCKALLITGVGREVRKRRRVVRPVSKGVRPTKSTHGNNTYKLRSSTNSAEGNMLNERTYYNKIKTHCLTGAVENLSCSLKDYLLDTTHNRYEASMCFLTVLKLATQGMLSLQQEGNDITVEIR